MTRVHYLILLSLILMLSGCFAPRSFRSLLGTDAIGEPVAILPVIPAHITMPVHSEKDYLEMAEKTNSILNTLAGGRKSKLLGPRKVLNILNRSDVESLHRILDDSGDHPTVWQSERLAEMSQRLGVEKIIRVQVEIMDSPAPDTRWGYRGGALVGWGDHWRGWVFVSAALFGMSPRQLIAARGSVKEFWGKIGVGCLIQCIPFPYTVGKTEARALDQAAREAIPQLLKEITEGHSDEDGWIE